MWTSRMGERGEGTVRGREEVGRGRETEKGEEGRQKLEFSGD